MHQILLNQVINCASRDGFQPVPEYYPPITKTQRQRTPHLSLLEESWGDESLGDCKSD